MMSCAQWRIPAHLSRQSDDNRMSRGLRGCCNPSRLYRALSTVQPAARLYVARALESLAALAGHLETKGLEP